MTLVLFQRIHLFQSIPNSELHCQLEAALVFAKAFNQIDVEWIILTFMQSTDNQNVDQFTALMIAFAQFQKFFECIVDILKVDRLKLKKIILPLRT